MLVNTANYRVSDERDEIVVVNFGDIPVIALYHDQNERIRNRGRKPLRNWDLGTVSDWQDHPIQVDYVEKGLVSIDRRCLGKVPYFIAG